MRPKNLRKYPVIAHCRGIALLTIIFTLGVVAILALMATSIIENQSTSAGRRLRSSTAFYAAGSGLMWARQKTGSLTTYDKAKFLALDKTTKKITPSKSERFTLSVVYVDSDNNRETDDKVTFIATGVADGAKGAIKRVVEVTYTVPAPPGSSALYTNTFDQPTVEDFDRFVFASLSPMAHGPGDPLVTIGSGAGGDLTGAFTHSSESGGSPGVLKVTAPTYGDARLMIHTGACIKQSQVSAGDPCGYSSCATVGQCLAREGLSIAEDTAGFVNYFIKLRVRLLIGNGFGVYFRASYQNMTDPNNIDFATLTGYVWQYDAGFGYLSPCNFSTAAPGSDGFGMFASRRIENGSERCGAGCSVFSAPSGTPSVWPIFCPENKPTTPTLPGWGWGNNNWWPNFRTVYIYVFQNKATIYLGREEISGQGSESAPELVGTIFLDSVAGLLTTGDIGFRIWSGGVAEIDYLVIYPNDTDLNPATFPGEP